MNHNHVDSYGNHAPCHLREQFEVAETNLEFNEIESPDNSDLYVEPAPIYIPDPDPRASKPNLGDPEDLLAKDITE